MPDWFTTILGIIASIVTGLGILGKFALEFIKAERAESGKLTVAFIEQLKSQSSECTAERLQMHTANEKLQERMFQTMLQVTEVLKDHTEKSKENYRISEDLLKSQSTLIQKFTDFTDVIAMDKEHKP